MASNELVFKNASELGVLIRKKQISPVELVNAYLEHINLLNPTLNAFITITRELALERARTAEKDIARGKYIGPLHGIPYALKDIIATKGIRTTNGSKVTADWVPPYESTISDRLTRAGAILLGKLNLNEFATGSGVLSGFGPVCNPWHLDYSPGGSSSGPGAAVAAYMTPLAIGTDTGGSIRGPAALCGIVGVKQTYGRVSRFGVTADSWTLDHAGPMTKTVADAATVLQVIAGLDPQDKATSSQPVPDYTKSLTGNVKGLRIGIPQRFLFDGTSAEVDTAVRAAIQKLVDMGATTVDVDVPHAVHAALALRIIIGSECSCFHEKRLKEKADLFDPLVRERLSAAKYFMATDYIKAMRLRTIVMAEMEEVFKKCDVMAVPTSGSVAGKRQSPETARTEVRPDSSATPGTGGGGTNALGNMTGIPAIAIPCGFSSNEPTLPMSIQFYGRPFDEATLFRVSHAYQSVTDWHKRRPPLTMATD